MDSWLDLVDNDSMNNEYKSMNMVRTFNLATGEAGPVFVGLSPEDAVRAANAQSQGDFNTWDYGKYELVENELTVRSGDFTARKESLGRGVIQAKVGSGDGGLRLGDREP